jgi:hypothetical protein
MANDTCPFHSECLPICILLTLVRVVPGSAGGWLAVLCIINKLLLCVLFYGGNLY